jgi:acetoin utilization deacetylase AcuC-like enzyme
MKVVFHEDFYQIYTSDPAAAGGRIEAIVDVIEPVVEFIEAVPATEKDIQAVHDRAHIDDVRHQGLFPISALAAGGAIQAATLGLDAPSFGLVRPPGHHASSGSAWGFCFFNNMAIALMALKKQKKIDSAYVLDIDLHYGDGTVNILEGQSWVTIHNMEAATRTAYMDEIAQEMEVCQVDLIGISAGFDNHQEDWGGLLLTSDYQEIGKMVFEAAVRHGAGCFGILEGGYKHQVLGHNVKALLEGLASGL